MDSSNNNKKGSSVISWLGFGISTFVLLLILFINLLLFNSRDSFDFIASIYVILFFVGGLLGLLGFIFSIAGLIMAIKNYTPKWIGVCGIVISCISFVSFFAIPIIANTSKEKEPTEVITPPSVLENTDGDTNQVVIQINDDKSVICYIEEDSSSRLEMNMGDVQFQKQFTSWLNDHLKSVDPNTPITIVSSSKLDYSYVNPVLDLLQESGHSRFSLNTIEDNY